MAESCFLSQMSGCKASSQLTSHLLKLVQPCNTLVSGQSLCLIRFESYFGLDIYKTNVWYNHIASRNRFSEIPSTQMHMHDNGHGASPEARLHHEIPLLYDMPAAGRWLFPAHDHHDDTENLHYSEPSWWHNACSLPPHFFEHRK